MDTDQSRVNLYQVCSHVLLFMFKSLSIIIILKIDYVHFYMYLYSYLRLHFLFFPKRLSSISPTLSSAFHSKMGSLFGICCVILLKIIPFDYSCMIYFRNLSTSNTSFTIPKKYEIYIFP